jgi:tRNA (adenine37-N6)-methyltransferase
VLDIKPYLPWAESRPEARAGFAPEAPPQLPVAFSDAAHAALAERPDGDSLRELIIQVLAQDPRPAYHSAGRKEGEARIYGVRLRDLDVRFHAKEQAGELCMEVVEIVPA